MCPGAMSTHGKGTGEQQDPEAGPAQLFCKALVSSKDSDGGHLNGALHFHNAKNIMMG